ncbi:Helix-turn-helix domain-containing protein [Anaerovirgula multivorans]|uniref:Helix-turn-helix domain-containing protein n=1 Tax=Anaerovirgula multivorans TaxID=312168 RepID=A0A239KU69_9FIRM|nr:helix-turn-helix domain-containing protein [Anaerovirgula multivorans]SNT21615.1 Helix-turn-helix domain-containing protein [Anaerovirgula multivorans]
MNNKSLLIERVYKLELTQRATLVAFYLINRADQENTCFPGVKTIANECHMSTRTVQRALNDLEESGFLKRESRFHEMGGQRSNMYYLQIGEMNDLEDDEDRGVAYSEASSQGVVQDDELNKMDNVGSDKTTECAYNSKFDYLESVEKIDFSIYIGNNVASLPVSRGLCQRDGP